MTAAYVTGGFIGNRLVSGLVLPMVPQLTSMPIMRIASKGVVAWGLGWVSSMLLGRKAGNLIMIGGFVDVLDDAVKTYVAPFVPALAGNDMSAYPMLPMGAYPSLGNYTDPYGNAVVGAEYSSADEV